MLFLISACSISSVFDTQIETPSDISLSTEQPTTAPILDNNVILNEEAKEYIGYWQFGLGIGAGYGERYAFNEDGTFWWAKSEYMGGERLIASKGRWIYSDGKIILTTTDEYHIFGGKVVEDVISSDGKYIEGGQLKKISQLDSVINFEVSKVSESEEYGAIFFTFDDRELYNYNNQLDFFDKELYVD